MPDLEGFFPGSHGINNTELEHKIGNGQRIGFYFTIIEINHLVIAHITTHCENDKL